MVNFNSKTTLSEIITNSNVFGNDLNKITIIDIMKSIFTERINNNISIDEIFIIIIIIISIIVIILKYSDLIIKINPNYNLSDEDNKQISKYHDSFLYLQCIIIAIYVFYIIRMIINNKNYILTNRYTTLFNYFITICTIIYFIFIVKNKGTIK